MTWSGCQQRLVLGTEHSTVVVLECQERGDDDDDDDTSRQAQLVGANNC